jgi:hypothetical protein
MKRRRCRLDPRLVFTVLAGALGVALREATRAPAPPPPAAAAVPKSVELPLPPAWRGPGAEGELQLQPTATRAHFSVHSTLQSTEAAAPGIRGTLSYDAQGNPAVVSLAIELERLQAGSGDDLCRLLGCKRTDVLTWTGHVVARTSFAVPGIQRLDLVGPLQFAGRVRSQPMQLWLAQLLPGRAVLQGVGTVDGEDFGLPRRYLWGIVRDRHEITLALHLEFARTPEGR